MINKKKEGTALSLSRVVSLKAEPSERSTIEGSRQAARRGLPIKEKKIKEYAEDFTQQNNENNNFDAQSANYNTKADTDFKNRVMKTKQNTEPLQDDPYALFQSSDKDSSA